MWQSAFKILLSGNNITRILGGLETTIVISLTSIVLGTLIGIVLGALWTLSGKWVKLVFKIYLEIFRIIPTIPLLFLFYYILPRDLGVNLPAVQVSILVFALWFAAEFSDIIRGSIQSVPRQQRESAFALGLSTFQIFRYVLIPQGLLTAISPFINLSTRIIKTTSILLLISVTDVITVGQQIIEANSQNAVIPILIYGIIALLYWLVNAVLGYLADYVEGKQINDR
ncbi:amino acid ABC transporter permease [Pediococcus pentosaceus]|uniref:Amino acid ABC transporter permease n=1 Tax=Pediococcus pentosaceus TaxID=1255 RepID=A0AB73HHU3_PEDPE|nr:amino acid ABC transporter permease [Pediococcus pentosaceus]MBF7115820.1 amino acid ABC transporter permease [Pediococcus pentosaceus]